MPQNDQTRAIGSDGWMLEQQLRAEWEAAEWRRLRSEMALPPPIPEYVRPSRPLHEGGSIILKGLVRFGIGAFGAWMGYIAAANSDVGEFEIWLWTMAGFVIALAFSAIGPFRQFVALLAEITRWLLIVGVIVGAVWMIVQMRSA